MCVIKCRNKLSALLFHSFTPNLMAKSQPLPACFERPSRPPKNCSSSVIAILLASEVTLANDLDLVIFNLLQEAIVEFLGVDSVLFFIGAFCGGLDLDVVGGVNLHVLGEPIFVSEQFEGHGGGARVRVAVLHGVVRDQLSDVLFKLAQVLGDVALSE